MHRKVKPWQLILITAAVIFGAGWVGCKSLSRLPHNQTNNNSSPSTSNPPHPATELFFTDYIGSGCNTANLPVIQALRQDIADARESIRVAIYSLSLTEIGNALIDAAQRGVNVELVMESQNRDSSVEENLVAAGIPIAGDGNDGLMHDKFVIIDSTVVWTGSMNLTSTSVCENLNNFLRVDAKEIAGVYATEFEEMFTNHRFGQDSPWGKQNNNLFIEGHRVEVLFAPEDHVADRIVELLSNSIQGVDMLAYSFTLDSLAETLVALSGRGVTIRGVMDEEQVYNNIGTEYDRMRQAGLDFHLDGAPAAMHDKVIIIDGNIVILGSFNFTRSADERNDENVLILYDPEIAKLYEAEFEKIFSNAQP